MVKGPAPGPVGELENRDTYDRGMSGTDQSSDTRRAGDLEMMSLHSSSTSEHNEGSDMEECEEEADTAMGEAGLQDEAPVRLSGAAQAASRADRARRRGGTQVSTESSVQHTDLFGDDSDESMGGQAESMAEDQHHAVASGSGVSRRQTRHHVCSENLQDRRRVVGVEAESNVVPRRRSARHNN